MSAAWGLATLLCGNKALSRCSVLGLQGGGNKQRAGPWCYQEPCPLRKSFQALAFFTQLKGVML